MMKIKYIILVLTIMSSMPLFAQEGDTGFYGAADLNFAVGFNTGDSNGSNSDTGIGISLRPGYRLSEEWIGMLDLSWTRYSDGVVKSTLAAYMIAGQYYFMPEAYIRPSIGFSKTKVRVSGFGSAETDLGLALGFAGGYEFPVMEQLVVGPTARIIYNRINPSGPGGGNANFWNISVGIEGKYAF